MPANHSPELPNLASLPARLRAAGLIYPLTFALWALATLGVLAFIVRDGIAHAEREFSAYGTVVETQLRDKLRANEAVLYSFASFLETRSKADRADVAEFAESIRERYPHIYELQVSRRVARAEVPNFVPVSHCAKPPPRRARGGPGVRRCHAPCRISRLPHPRIYGPRAT